MTADPDITLILDQLAAEHRDLAPQDLQALYTQLRGVARGHMARQPAGHSLEVTVLANDAWMRIQSMQDLAFDSRKGFRALASRIIGNLLAEHARRAATAKRGGDRQRVDDSIVMAEMGDKALSPDEFLDLHAALELLRRVDARSAEVVELRFFGGLSLEETADAMGVSTSQVGILYRTARGWLRSKLEGGAQASG